MPYSSVSELPAEVKKKYTSKQQRAFRKAFNDAVKQGKSEEQAFKIAHRAAQRAGDRDAVQNAKAGKSDNAGQEPIMTEKIVCPDCDRSFFDEALLADHAEAVHTHDEVYELLNGALEAKFGRRTYIRAVADDYVVFVRWTDHGYDMEHRSMLKASYTIDDNGSVTFGDPTEVRQKTSFVPVPSDSASEEDETDDTDETAAVGAVHGTPSTDLPHNFSQDEGSHPFFCSECGRSRPHPLHNPPSAEGDR